MFTANPTDLLTRAEVERRLHVSGRTIYRLIDDGKLAAHKIGRDLRFAPADVDAFIAASRVSR